MKDLLYEVEGLLPEKVVISVKDQLKLSEDIDSEVDKAAGVYGYYAVLSERAETRYQKMKLAFEKWQAETESRYFHEKREEIKSSSKDLKLKMPTEAQMKAYVRTQSKFRAYQIRLIEYDEHRRILKVLARAFEMKIHLVQTKSANRRKES
jgi:hypothetical protein